jgi:hypothetical protein
MSVDQWADITEEDSCSDGECGRCSTGGERAASRTDTAGSTMFGACNGHIALANGEGACCGGGSASADQQQTVWAAARQRTAGGRKKGVV